MNNQEFHLKTTNVYLPTITTIFTENK